MQDEPQANTPRPSTTQSAAPETTLRLLSAGVESIRLLARAIEGASVRSAAVQLYASGIRTREDAEKAWKAIRMIRQVRRDLARQTSPR